MAQILSDFLKQQPQKSLGNLLTEIADICAKIATLTARGALSEISNKLEGANIQGEAQTKLDVLSNDLFVDQLKNCGLVAGLASEEMDEIIAVSADEKAGYLVLFDPLDGSSNVAINVTVGSIFSILAAPKGKLPTKADFLQPGHKQLAAGYALYGPATMLVLSLGKGTHGFTLDPTSSTFVLTHPDMRVADTSAEFAINASNERFWYSPIQRYIMECKAGVDGVRERDFNMRWVASMVAEIHRILLRGGVYLYPHDSKKPQKAGRLRLMYELNPMSMLVEQAGGKSSTGDMRVMDIIPSDIHQRVPIAIGTEQEVSLIERYTEAHKEGETEKRYTTLFNERPLYHKKQ